MDQKIARILLALGHRAALICLLALPANGCGGHDGARGAQPGSMETVINGIRHPGMMTSLTALKNIKTRYEAGETYYKGRVAEMRALVERTDRRLHNPQIDNTVLGGGGALIYCGGDNLGQDGKKVMACDWPVEDGIDAYTFALLGYVTGDAAYSRTALSYLESWTDPDHFVGFDPTGLNAPLQHGWTIPWYSNAAEILRHTYTGWEDRHTTAMNGFIERMLPLVLRDNVGAPNNWLHSRIEAHMSAAIFLSDAVMLAAAVDRWKTHTRSYIYIDADRGTPIMPGSSQIATRGAAYWSTPRFVAGMTMETCRDLGHQGLGMRSIFNSLAMAVNQGEDMLRGNDNRERLATFLEVMPVWTQSRMDHPDGICNNPVVISPGANPLLLSQSPVRYAFDIGYKLLDTNERPLLRAREDIDKSSPTGASRWVTKWEALTHH